MCNANDNRNPFLEKASELFEMNTRTGHVLETVHSIDMYRFILNLSTVFIDVFTVQ